MYKPTKILMVVLTAQSRHWVRNFPPNVAMTAMAINQIAKIR